MLLLSFLGSGATHLGCLVFQWGVPVSGVCQLHGSLSSVLEVQVFQRLDSGVQGVKVFESDCFGLPWVRSVRSQPSRKSFLFALSVRACRSFVLSRPPVCAIFVGGTVGLSLCAVMP